MLLEELIKLALEPLAKLICQAWLCLYGTPERRCSPARPAAPWIRRPQHPSAMVSMPKALAPVENQFNDIHIDLIVTHI